MPRITSGSAKNKNIKIPDVLNIRVVQDVVKLAVFSILGEKVLDAACLDLYAGSGNLGIEALSRGARWCDFVDTNKKAIEGIKANLKLATTQERNLEESSQTILSDAVKYAANTMQEYDIIFCDPFYDDLKHKYLLHNLAQILSPKGVLVFLHGKNLNLPEQIAETPLLIETQRKFGATVVSVLVKKQFI